MVAVIAEKADRLEQRNLPLELGQQERRDADLTPDNGCEDAGAVALRQRNGCGPARCVRDQYALVFYEIGSSVEASRSEEEKSAGGSKAKRALRHRKALRPISDGSRWLEPKRLLAAKRWKRP